MSILLFTGRATKVAQVTTIQITADDAATTYTLTVGGVAISVPGSGTGEADTATALAAAWNASTHVYCSTVTAVAVTDTVTLTADVAGDPFVVAASVAGGAGTIGAATEATASAGPNDFSTAANWSTGVVPAAGDTVTFADCDVAVLWGLDQTANAFALIVKYKSHAGAIGLPRGSFKTDGVDNPGAVEYRTDYLTTPTPLVRIGEDYGSSSSQTADSPLVKIDTLTAAAADIEVFGSGRSLDSKPPVRIRCNHASATLKLYGNASVALADEDPADVSVLADIACYGTGGLIVGAGVTNDTTRIVAGSAVIKNAPTTLQIENGASVDAVGSGTITTLDKRGELNMIGGSYTVTTLKG